MKYLIISLSLLVLCGCVGPFNVLTNVLGGTDFFTRLATDKGVVDHVISEGQGKNCKISNLLKEKKLCEESLIDIMMKMKCRTFRWTVNGDVVCKEYEKK